MRESRDYGSAVRVRNLTTIEVADDRKALVASAEAKSPGRIFTITKTNQMRAKPKVQGDRKALVASAEAKSPGRLRRGEISLFAVTIAIFFSFILQLLLI